LSLGQAILYFLGEALIGLRRSWKVSLLAIITIAVSLFIGGMFLLVSGNLSRIVGEWRSEAKIVLYLAPEESERRANEVAANLAGESWISGVETISREEAERRFAGVFPTLSTLLEGWDESPLPASLEVSYDADGVSEEALGEWLTRVSDEPGVEMVDDDRQWLRQLELIVVMTRGVGLGLGAVLLAAAIFTIASVVRLTAYLYREEISIMRLVGATEFFIRGPFLAAGLIQGLLGGGLALAGLFAAYHLVGARQLPTVLGSTLFSSFLTLAQVALLLALGGAAGLLGAALSLRRGTAVEEAGA
jgi:cell division transport system permease protein